MLCENLINMHKYSHITYLCSGSSKPFRRVLNNEYCKIKIKKVTVVVTITIVNYLLISHFKILL